MMPPRQEGPALAGGLCTGLQFFSPAFLAFTSVTVEKLQRLVPSFEAACASTEGVVRGPLSCLDVPRALATDDLIGINLMVNPLRVFRSANTAHLCSGGGPARWTCMVASEKCVARQSSTQDDMRMITVYFP